MGRKICKNCLVCGVAIANANNPIKKYCKNCSRELNRIRSRIGSLKRIVCHHEEGISKAKIGIEMFQKKIKEMIKEELT